MKVKVAAAQLSHTVAAVIGTYVALQVLPSEAIYTAEFVETIDNLLDSLNSCNQNAHESKLYRCALSGNSPHIEFWNKFLKEIGTWKIIDLKTGRDKTCMFSFIDGWQITIRSVIFLWNRLKKVGFKYLNLKALNQDPLENAFCCIRQHGISNTNSTCFQFIAALKTCIVNNMALPFKTMSNCESDDCFPLSNLCQFLKSADDDNPGVSGTGSVDPEGINYCVSQTSESHSELLEDNQAVTYVAGYILKVLNVNNECDVCVCCTHAIYPVTKCTLA
ncbi:uncharacterized protein [Anabrus simplex]|uniref:uncharacterized protein n=1 Tax=Anabrus simplex TaxID=316456 RepID=UPI0035A2B437